VREGEVLGVIGRNGAGKSTLLKILSRITEPTTGHVAIRGRVASLLEVGTGFHPELTGRENVLLNGAILGMRKSEIEGKYDEIVDFSGVEKFMDTPVKRYSTGMRLRLAFAVAAYLEPEVLLVDEVLAVGDAEFQKKSLGKMEAVAGEGRTVLFVSHNMQVMQRLCERGIVLHDGEVRMDGPIATTVEEYLGGSAELEGERSWPDPARAPGNDVVRLLRIRTTNQHGDTWQEFDVHEQLSLEFDYHVLKEGHQLSTGIELINSSGDPVLISLDNYIHGRWGDQQPHETGTFTSSCVIPGDLLNEGEVSFNLRIFSPPWEPNSQPHVREKGVLRLRIVDRMNTCGVRGSYPYNWGKPAVRPRLSWTTRRTDREAVHSTSTAQVPR
jgi:lipopolysaccharide transport system ATP-binding protein